MRNKVWIGNSLLLVDWVSTWCKTFKKHSQITIVFIVHVKMFVNCCCSSCTFEILNEHWIEALCVLIQIHRLCNATTSSFLPTILGVMHRPLLFQVLFLLLFLALSFKKRVFLSPNVRQTFVLWLCAIFCVMFSLHFLWKCFESSVSRLLDSVKCIYFCGFVKKRSAIDSWPFAYDPSHSFIFRQPFIGFKVFPLPSFTLTNALCLRFLLFCSLNDAMTATNKTASVDCSLHAKMCILHFSSSINVIFNSLLFHYVLSEYTDTQSLSVFFVQCASSLASISASPRLCHTKLVNSQKHHFTENI